MPKKSQRQLALLRQMRDAGVPLEIPEDDFAPQILPPEALKINQAGQCSAMHVPPCRTAYILDVHIVPNASWSLELSSVVLELPWEDPFFFWLQDPLERDARYSIYWVTDDSSLAYGRDEVINHLIGPPHRFQRGHTVAGLLLGSGTEMPEHVQHGATIPAFIRISDQFGEHVLSDSFHYCGSLRYTQAPGGSRIGGHPRQCSSSSSRLRTRRCQRSPTNQTEIPAIKTMKERFPKKRADWIRERAIALGFDLCGIAPAEIFPELRRLPEWIEHGYAGEMNYLRDERRGDPQRALEGARSLIVVALNYNTPHPRSIARPQPAGEEDTQREPPRGWISRYAWGDDYHLVLKAKLDQLVCEMRAEFSEPFDARAYVDTGPIIERVAAKYAGLGWLAKNTSLINQQLGSWLFLGVIVTTLDLQASLRPEQLPPPDLCGSCTRCLDACPTQAFPQPYVLDSRLCISYLTIELRGAIPENLRASMGNAVIGCDICQDVCPWNRKAPLTKLEAFEPRATTAAPADSQAAPAIHQKSFLAPELESLASLSQSEFSELFRGSAAKRAKWRGLVRNSCVALGNSGLRGDSPGFPRVARLLGNLVASGDSLIAEHAAWALAQLAANGSPSQSPSESKVRVDAARD